jgi:hypothetical protein
MSLEDSKNGVLSEFEIAQLNWYTGTKMVQPMLPWREEDNGTTKYEQFTDGIALRHYNGGKAILEEKTVIRKTVKTGNVISRYHAIGFWDDRASLEYIPVCQALNPSLLRSNPKFQRWIEEPASAKLHIVD